MAWGLAFFAEPGDLLIFPSAWIGFKVPQEGNQMVYLEIIILLKSYLTRIKASFSMLTRWAARGSRQFFSVHVWWQSFNFIIRRSFKMMIDFKDAVNLATNKDLWRNFGSSISIRSPLLAVSRSPSAPCASCGFEFRRGGMGIKKAISAPFSELHFSFHLGDIQDGYLKPLNS